MANTGSDNQLFVGRLNKKTRESDLREVFERYGRLIRCDVKVGVAVAYAFVDFYEREDAKEAMRKEHRRELLGRNMIIEWARQGDRGKYDDDCHKCGKRGHFASECRSALYDRDGKSKRYAILQDGLLFFFCLLINVKCPVERQLLLGGSSIIQFHLSD